MSRLDQEQETKEFLRECRGLARRYGVQEFEVNVRRANLRRSIYVTPDGVAGGQGRSAREMRETAINGILLAAIAAVIYLVVLISLW